MHFRKIEIMCMRENLFKKKKTANESTWYTTHPQDLMSYMREEKKKILERVIRKVSLVNT